jgi:cohesin complex subunit SA-1/2
MYFLWKSSRFSKHIEASTQIPEDELELVATRRDACITALMRILESRKGADEVRVEAANLLLDLYNMFRALKAVKAKASKGSKKPNGRAADEANDDWEALCQDIDLPTVKVLLQVLTALETNLAKRIRKRLEEPDVDDDPVDPDDEPESSDDEAEDTHTQHQKQIRNLLAEERLCTFGSRIVQGVQVGTLDSEDSSVRTRLERNKAKLTSTWKEVVGHLDANKHAKAKAGKKAQAAAKTPAKQSKSKETVIEDDSEEEEEQQDDPIEDEEMADADEQVNGDGGAEEGDDAVEQSPEAESVLGD